MDSTDQFIGEWSVFAGKLMHHDDYGNASYGAWGREYGYKLSFLKRAADIDQRGDTGIPDPARDQYFIEFGFNLLR